MLVLSRHSGQRIQVGGDIVITVLGAKNGSVRLGIDAPRDVAVDRQEIFERKRMELAEPAFAPRKPR